MNNILYNPTADQNLLVVLVLLVGLLVMIGVLMSLIGICSLYSEMKRIKKEHRRKKFLRARRLRDMKIIRQFEEYKRATYRKAKARYIVNNIIEASRTKAISI